MPVRKYRISWDMSISRWREVMRGVGAGATRQELGEDEVGGSELYWKRGGRSVADRMDLQRFSVHINIVQSSIRALTTLSDWPLIGLDPFDHRYMFWLAYA